MKSIFIAILSSASENKEKSLYLLLSLSLYYYVIQIFQKKIALNTTIISLDYFVTY